MTWPGTLAAVGIADDFLAQLDATAKQYKFPLLDNGYSYAIDARLHLYRDDRRWAVLVETVGFNPREWAVLDVLHWYGNCLDGGEPGFGDSDFLDRIENMDDLVDDDECLRGGVPVVIRGTEVTVDAPAGEGFERFARRLVPAHRDLLLADGTEARRRIPSDLAEILRLEEWNHPDVMEAGQPSQHETFRLLAEVLETGDVGRYRPGKRPNTHWSNWPESGTL